jgi:hypothetical protein
MAELNNLILHCATDSTLAPLLLIAWRRPHTMSQVIDALRPVAPVRLCPLP